MSIYFVTYIANTTWPKITRDWYHKSLSDQHATKLGDFLCWKGCCGSPGFFWFVSFGCLLWGVNFLYEKGQSLSRQYFITIWWFPQVLSPNHRLVFIAKSNVFLSSTIWCLKHQLHDHSLACSWNGSQSSHDNGWPIFFRQLLRITKAVVNQFVNFDPRKIRELMIFFGISRLILHVKQKPFILKCQRLWANSSYNWQRHFISVTYFTHGNPVTINWKLISFYLHAFKT